MITRKHVRSILIGIAFLATLPILIYIGTFTGGISSDNNDWIAFGGIFYGAIIAGITLYNTFVVYTISIRDRQFNKEQLKLNKMQEYRDNFQDFYKMFMEVVPKSISKKINEINAEVYNFNTKKKYYFSEEVQLKSQEIADLLNEYTDKVVFTESFLDTYQGVELKDLGEDVVTDYRKRYELGRALRNSIGELHTKINEETAEATKNFHS